MKFTNICILVLVLVLSQIASAQIQERTLAIGHRGFDSIYPENILEGFNAACYLGVDYVELDIQITADHYLLVSHDAYLSRQTDVASRPEFAQKKRSFNNKTDWWVFDFTLQEIKTLRTVQGQLASKRLGILNGRFQMPTLEELIQEHVAFNMKYQGSRNPDGNRCGLLIESKDPAYYRSMWGVEQGKLIVDLLSSYHLDNITNATIYCPVMLHSFDAQTVKLWHNYTSIYNSQLFDASNQPYPLDVIATYAKCIGVSLAALFNNTKYQSTGLAEQAHSLGMCVHGWTFQDDNIIMGKTNLEQYWIGQKILKLDAFHSEFPAEAVSIVQVYKNLTVFPAANPHLASILQQNDEDNPYIEQTSEQLQ